MAVEYLDKGNDDGTVLGQSASSKLGFYGLSLCYIRTKPGLFWVKAGF